MMLTIHGIPVSVKFYDLRALIKRECNLDDFILDGLTDDVDGNKKTRIGVADESEGAHLSKCLNGYRIGGSVLRVMPVAKPPKIQSSNNLVQLGGFKTNQPGYFGNQPANYSNQPSNYSNQPGNFSNQPGNFSNQPGNFCNQPGNFNNHQSRAGPLGSAPQSNQWIPKQQPHNQMQQTNFEYQQRPYQQLSPKQQSGPPALRPGAKPFIQPGPFNQNRPAPEQGFGFTPKPTQVAPQWRPERSHVLRSVEITQGSGGRYPDQGKPNSQQKPSQFGKPDIPTFESKREIPKDFDKTRPALYGAPERRLSPHGRVPDRRISPGRRVSPPGRRVDIPTFESKREIPKDFDKIRPALHGAPERRLSPHGRVPDRRILPGRRVSPPGRRIAPTGIRDSPTVRRVSPIARKMSPGRKVSPTARRMSPRRRISPGRRMSPRRKSPPRQSPSRRVESPPRVTGRYSPLRRHDKMPFEDRVKQVKAPNQAMYSGGYRPNEKIPYPPRQVEPPNLPWQDRDKNVYPVMTKPDDDRRMIRGGEPEANRSPMRESRSPSRRDGRERSPLRDRYRKHSPSPRSPRRSWALEKRNSPEINEAPPPPVWPGQNQEEQYGRSTGKPDPTKHVPVWDHRTYDGTKEELSRDSRSFNEAQIRVRRDMGPRDITAPVSRRELSPRRHGFKPPDEQLNRDPKFEPRDPKFATRGHKFEPHDSKFEPRGPKYEPRDPKFASRDPKFEPREPKYELHVPQFEQRDAKFAPRDPKYEPHDPKFEPRDPKYEPRDPKFASRDPKFEPRDSKYEPHVPQFEQRDAKFAPRDPEYDPRHPKFEPHDTKFEQRDAKYMVRESKLGQLSVIKYDPRDPKFQPHVHRFPSHVPKFEPRGPTIEPRDDKFEQRENKFDNRSPKFGEPREPKFESRGNEFSSGFQPTGPKFQPRDPHSDPRDRNFEPRNSTYEQRELKFKPTFESGDHKFQQRDPKLEPRESKYESRDPKFHSRDHQFERDEFKDHNPRHVDIRPERKNYPDKDKFRDYQKSEPRDSLTRRDDSKEIRKTHDIINKEFEVIYKRTVDYTQEGGELKRVDRSRDREEYPRDSRRREAEDDGRQMVDSKRRPRDDHLIMETEGRHQDGRPDSHHSAEYTKPRDRQPEWKPREMSSKRFFLALDVKCRRDKAVIDISRRLLQKYVCDIDDQIIDRVKDELRLTLGKILFDQFGDKYVPVQELVDSFKAKHNADDELKIIKGVMACFPKQHRVMVMKRLAQDTERSEIPAKRSAPDSNLKEGSGAKTNVRPLKKPVPVKRPYVEAFAAPKHKAAEPAQKRPAPSPAAAEPRALDANSARALDAALQQVMIEVWQLLPDEASAEEESAALDIMRNEVSDDLRNALGLNVTKRLLNTFNPLNVKVHFSTKPERKYLSLFLKRYNFVAFKRIVTMTNTFAAQVKTITEYDDLCSNKEIYCGTAKLTIKPCYRFTQCPKNLTTIYGSPLEDISARHDECSEKESETTGVQNESKKENAQNGDNVINKEITAPKSNKVEEKKINENMEDNITKNVVKITNTATQTIAEEGTQTTMTDIETDSTTKTSEDAIKTSIKLETSKTVNVQKSNAVVESKTNTCTTKSTLRTQIAKVITDNVTADVPIVKISTTTEKALTNNNPLTGIKLTNVAISKPTDSPVAKATVTPAPNKTPAKAIAAKVTPNKAQAQMTATTVSANKAPTKRTDTTVDQDKTPAKPTENKAPAKVAKNIVFPNKTPNKPTETKVAANATAAKATDSHTTPNKTPANKATKTIANAKPAQNKANVAATTKPSPKITNTASKPAQGKANPAATSKPTPKKTSATNDKKQTNIKNAPQDDDFEELDDHGLYLYLMSAGIVLDECSGSDDE